MVETIAIETEKVNEGETVPLASSLLMNSPNHFEKKSINKIAGRRKNDCRNKRLSGTFIQVALIQKAIVILEGFDQFVQSIPLANQSYLLRKGRVSLKDRGVHLPDIEVDIKLPHRKPDHHR